MLVQAQHMKRGEIKFNSAFVSLTRFLEMRKWNRLSRCLWLGLNGDETTCNSEPAEAMTCQPARLQSTATASSDPPPPPSLSPLALRGDVCSSQRPLRHSLHTCYFQEEEKLRVCSSVWYPSLFISALSSPVGCVLLVDLLQTYHTLSSTQQTRLISSRSITGSSLKDTSGRCASVAGELLRVWARWCVG